MWAVINWCKRMKEEGNQLILWTCRGGQDLVNALEACNQVGLQFDEVNCNLEEKIARHDGNDSRKVGADIYLDDKALRPEDIV